MGDVEAVGVAVAGAEVRPGGGVVVVMVMGVVVGVGALKLDELLCAASGGLDEDFGLHRGGGGPGSWEARGVVCIGLLGFGVGTRCSEQVRLSTTLSGLFAGG